MLSPDVVGTGSEALLSAQLDLSGVKEVAEELPAGGRFVAFLSDNGQT